MKTENLDFAIKIYSEKFNDLRNYTNSFLNNGVISEDIVQDLFLKLLCNSSISFKNENHAKYYIFKCLKYACINYKKNKVAKLAISYDNEDHIINKFIIDIDSSVEVEKDTLLLKEAIKNLPNKSSKVMNLGLIGLTNNEISQELGVSINTIKDHKKTAFKKIRMYFGSQAS